MAVFIGIVYRPHFRDMNDMQHTQIVRICIYTYIYVYIYIYIYIHIYMLIWLPLVEHPRMIFYTLTADNKKEEDRKITVYLH